MNLLNWNSSISYCWCGISWSFAYPEKESEELENFYGEEKGKKNFVSFFGIMFEGKKIPL